MLCFSSTTIFLVTAGSCGEIREIYGGYSRAREAENSRYFVWVITRAHVQVRSHVKFHYVHSNDCYTFRKQHASSTDMVLREGKLSAKKQYN